MKPCACFRVLHLFSSPPTRAEERNDGFSPGSVSLPGEGGGNEVMTQSEVIQLPPLQYRREVLPLLLRRTTKRREARIHTTVSTAIIVLNIPTTVITVMP